MDVQGVTLLRALKGAPLACLVALGLVGEAATQEWIQSATGYNRQAVERALKTLVTLGLVSRVNYRGWRLSERPCGTEDNRRSDENQRLGPATTTGVLNMLIKRSMDRTEAVAERASDENQRLGVGTSSEGEAEKRIESASAVAGTTEMLRGVYPEQEAEILRSAHTCPGCTRAPDASAGECRGVPGE